MSIFDSIMDNLDGVAEKLGVPADKVKGMMSSLTEKMSMDGDKMQAMQDFANEHGVSVDKIKEMLGGDGEGSILGKVTGFFDKDGDGNPVNDLTDMAKGLFGKKE